MKPVQGCPSARYVTAFKIAFDFTPVDLSMLQGTWQFMSTRLLSTPGKVHELCDDLESLWFVLLYQGLHFVQRNKPFRLQMDFLFDHVQECETTGTHTGGLGKETLYVSGDILMTETLKFESEPFTVIIRQIYSLFRALNKYYRAQDRKKKPSGLAMKGLRKLWSCAEVKRLLEEALDSDNWPENCTKVEDQYPHKANSTAMEKNAIASSYVKYFLGSRGEPSGTKRKREEDDPPVLENKRPKVDQPLWKWIWSSCASFVWG